MIKIIKERQPVTTKEYFIEFRYKDDPDADLKMIAVENNIAIEFSEEAMNEARAIATKRMVAEAEELGADAIVNIRYASSAIVQGAAEVIAYGTAVKFVTKRTFG